MNLSSRYAQFFGLTATITVISVAVALLVTSFTMPFVAWTILLFSLLACLAWTDALTETVPDVMTLALVASGLIHAAATGLPYLGYLAISGLLLAIGLLHSHLTGDEGWIGSGDFFLIAGINAWFGPVLVLDILALGSMGLLLHGLIVRRAAIALSPSVACAAAIIWLGGPLL